MKLETVVQTVSGVPYMTPTRGRQVYEHLIEHQLRSVLELGTYHGVSTCYLAAAVDELGGGSVITMDKQSAQDLDPNVMQLVERLGLAAIVEPVTAERSFTWDLRRMLMRDPRPTFDFVYLDGGHTWDVTGFAFFLVDLMVPTGGWLLFDDLEWTIGGSRALQNERWAKALSDDERNAHQVRDVFDVLVEGSGRYETRVDGNWGWARKLTNATG